MRIKHKQGEHFKLDQISPSSQERDNNQEKLSQTAFKKETKVDCSNDTFSICNGYAVECILLQLVTINKVKLELKSVNKDIEVISLPETVRVRGMEIDSGLYKREGGKVEVLVTSTLNKDTMMKKGT